MATESQKRPFDELLDVLGHVQRRKLLCALLTHNPQKDEPIVADDDSPDEEFTQLVAMRHVHLPKLEDYGFISWDRESNEVSKGPNFEDIRPILLLLVEHEDELPDGWL